MCDSILLRAAASRFAAVICLFAHSGYCSTLWFRLYKSRLFVSDNTLLCLQNCKSSQIIGYYVDLSNMKIKLFFENNPVTRYKLDTAQTLTYVSFCPHDLASKQFVEVS